jgi:hypothetical protein
MCRRQAYVGVLKQEHSGDWLDRSTLATTASSGCRSERWSRSTAGAMEHCLAAGLPSHCLHTKDEALRTRSDPHRYPGTLGEASYRDRCHLLSAFRY